MPMSTSLSYHVASNMNVEEANVAASSNAEKRQLKQENNNRLKDEMSKDTKKRWIFLKEHEDILEPFIPDKVKAKLDAIGGTKSDDDDIDIHPQPDAVVTRLRDYQLVGFNWMINMHNQGLGMILGDEMGLVSELVWIFFLNNNRMN